MRPIEILKDAVKNFSMNRLILLNYNKLFPIRINLNFFISNQFKDIELFEIKLFIWSKK